jgi:hypothetical protein
LIRENLKARVFAATGLILFYGRENAEKLHGHHLLIGALDRARSARRLLQRNCFRRVAPALALLGP